MAKNGRCHKIDFFCASAVQAAQERALSFTKIKRQTLYFREAHKVKSKINET